MGAGASTLPKVIDKANFSEITGGNIHDPIFDLYAINNVITRERLEELAQTVDCYFSYDSGDTNNSQYEELISGIHQYVSSRGISIKVSNPQSRKDICDDIDNARSVALFITENYIESVRSKNPDEKSFIDSVYSVRKKDGAELIPVILSPNVVYSQSWPPSLTSINAQAIDISRVVDTANAIAAAGEALFRRIVSVIQSVGSVSAVQRERRLQTVRPGVTSEEMQFYHWLSRVELSSNALRYLYCALICENGIRNVQTLAQHMNANPRYLYSLIGMTESDGASVSMAVASLNVGYNYVKKFSPVLTFENANYALKKAGDEVDSALVVDALMTVLQVAEASKDIRLRMFDSKYCSALGKLIQKHMDRSAVVHPAISVLALLCFDFEEARYYFGETIMCGMMINCIKKFSEDVSVSESGLKFVAALALTKQLRGKLRDCGACKVATHAFEIHLANPTVARWGCESLLNLQIDSFSNTTNLLVAGAHRILAQVLSVHEDNSDIVKAALKVLTFLAQDPDYRRELGDLCCQLSINHLNKSCDDAEKAALVCQAMDSFIVGNSVNRDNFGLMGACEALVLVFDSLRDVPAFWRFGIVTVCSLANGSLQNISKLRQLATVIKMLNLSLLSSGEDVEIARKHVATALSLLK